MLFCIFWSFAVDLVWPELNFDTQPSGFHSSCLTYGQSRKKKLWVNWLPVVETILQQAGTVILAIPVMNWYFQVMMSSRCCKVPNCRPFSNWRLWLQHWREWPVIGLNSFLGHFWTVGFIAQQDRGSGSPPEELHRITPEWKGYNLLPGLPSCQVCSTQNYCKEKQPEWWLEKSLFF